MKILVDVSAGQVVTDTLRGLGHDVVFVRDIDPRMADVDILAWAVRDARLVVTMDKDFGELVYQSRQPHAGVLLLRLEAMRSAERVVIVTDIFNNHSANLPGRFAVFQNGRLRIR